MDIELAKTFLAIVESGSFVNAAERVFVTQSTVETKISGHNLRYTQALLCAEAGIEQPEVLAALTHSTCRTTAGFRR